MCSFAVGRGTGSSSQLRGGGECLPREVMQVRTLQDPRKARTLPLPIPLLLSIGTEEVISGDIHFSLEWPQAPT